VIVALSTVYGPAKSEAMATWPAALVLDALTFTLMQSLSPNSAAAEPADGQVKKGCRDEKNVNGCVAHKKSIKKHENDAVNQYIVYVF
jgi:hypothetical protein